MTRESTQKGRFRCVVESLRLVVTLLLMMVVGVSGVKAQKVDYSGTYYIAYFGNNKYDPNDPANTNNHYWCPVDCSGSWKAWFQYYPDDDVEGDSKADTYSKTTNTGMEFLTTYRFKNDANYNSQQAVWVITKHETIANAYYIQHRASEKYLTLNGYMNGTSGTGLNRLRVHIQSTKASDNKSVFTIKMSNGYFLICPYSLDGQQWVNVSTDATNTTKQDTDANSLIGTTTKTGVSGLNVGGTLGYYSSGDGDPNSKWYLEDYIKRPTIGFDSNDNNKIVIINGTTASSGTVYYTTNGDDPTLEASDRQSFTGASVTIESFTDNTVIKAVAKVGDEYSNVVTFNAYLHIGSEHQYLMQTVDGGSFYMVPPITTESYVTTTNIPHAKMAWYLADAGQTFGNHYYYIVNNNTAQYLYCSGAKAADNAFVMKAANASGTVSARYRFMVVASEGGYNIIPEFFVPEATGMCMSKKNGNNVVTNLNLSDGTDDYSRWKFVVVPSSPKTQFDASFASTTSSMKCYLIKSANAPTLHLLPPTTEGGNATAKSTGANPNWFLLPVEDNDEWISSYHIKNGKTGEYLYFNGTAGENNENTFFTKSTIVQGDEDRYKFIIVRGANTTYPDAYNIIPYILKDQVNQALNSMFRNSNSTLRTHNSRVQASSLWEFEEVCLDPIFEQSGDNITISYITSTSDVYYTTDGTDPSTSGTLYDNSSWQASEKHGIRAIAKLKNNSSVKSQEVTLLNKPDILDEGPYPYKGTAWEPVTEVSIGSGTEIITAPTSPATYSVTYTNNTNAGEATVNVADVNADDTWYIMNASTAFTIDRAEVTVKADDKTKVYQTPPLDDPTLTATVTGMVNNESETLITYTLSREAGESVGSYTITPSGDEIQGNYQVTYETGVFQIGYEIHPTVTLENWVYGEPNEPSVSDSGAGAVTYYYKTKDAADDTYTEEQPVNVGNYTIKAEVAATSEYFAASATKDFSITKRSLTVKANAITKDYLDEDPELTFTVTGIQYNEDKNTVLFCELQRVTGEAKGEYAITSKSLTLLSTQNYNTPSFTGSTFTIKAKSLGDGGDPAPGISIYAKDNPWKVSVYTGKTAFTEGTDYTVSEKGDPDENGNYTITVTAVEGSNCTGAAKATYSANSKFYAVNGTTEKFTPYISTTSDMTTSSDLVPYIVTQVNSTIGTISIVPVSYIPKDEPVLLLAQSDVTGITTSPKNEATTPISESLISNNKLNIAPEGGVQVKATEAYIFYSYNENNKDIGEFVLTTAGTIKKGRYFLYNPKYQEPADPGTPTPAPARSLAIVKGDATGIIQLTNDEAREGENAVWYTIDGQKLSKKPTRKGLYIQNGKKLIVK